MLCGLLDIYQRFAGTAALVFEILFYLIYGDYYKLFTQKILFSRVDSFKKSTASQQKESKAYYSEPQT
jgi:hypothetical protein